MKFILFCAERGAGEQTEKCFNVFVADGSDIPLLGVNPMVTIGVSALAKGERLAKGFK